MASKVTDRTTPNRVGDTTRSMATATNRPIEADQRQETPWAVGGARTSGLLRAREISGFSFDDRRVDVRGWPVYSNDARLLGTVNALFVDVRAHSVRYLGVTTEPSASSKRRASVMVPVGMARRQHGRDVVLLPGVTAEQVASAPRLAQRPATAADEDAALVAFGIDSLRGLSAGERYNNAAFDERKLFGGPGDPLPHYPHRT